MDFWYSLLKLFLRVYIFICMRNVKVTGRDNLITGPKILIANHPNATDGFILPFILPEKLHFLIQENMFTQPLIGFLLNKAGQIPVVRGQGKDALNTALEHLSQGRSVVIFPEGKLNHGKRLHRAGSGAAVLARKSGAPIVPIGFYVPQKDIVILKGRVGQRKTFGCWQVGGCCYVCVGKPWSVSNSGEEIIPRPRLHEITNRMMAQISDLVDQAQQAAEEDSPHLAANGKRHLLTTARFYIKRTGYAKYVTLRKMASFCNYYRLIVGAIFHEWQRG